MPRGLSGWTYRDVKDFLKDYKFSFSDYLFGSHEAWISENRNAVVEVNRLDGGHTYPERTLETMIRQSGLNKNEWREWANRGKRKK